MPSDKVRPLTYQLALTRARRRLEGGVLLDVGCGTGILSMFGAKAGAAHVYALDGVAKLCHLARQIIAENNFSSRITVINSKVEDAQLGVDRVDAIVNLTGAFASAVQQDLERRVHVDMIDARCVVTTTSEVATLDLATLSLEELSTHGVKGTFEARSMGTVSVLGFVICFSVDFHHSDVLSTSSHKASTHWQQSLLYLSGPLPLEQDEVLSGEVHFTHPEDAPRRRTAEREVVWSGEGVSGQGKTMAEVFCEYEKTLVGRGWGERLDFRPSL
uniref:Protein arginine methyltransferase n=1 Tax=Echinococcus granulosus TaxID=6210 RepID=A0A068WGA3_ECHGR|nr:protein arginine methyltransferase [Echinococcus granulosus]